MSWSSSKDDGEQVLQVRGELAQESFGESFVKTDQVRCSGTLCKESLGVAVPSSFLGGVGPIAQPLVAFGWSMQALRATFSGSAMPCHQGAPDTLGSAGAVEVVSDSGVPAMVVPVGSLTKTPKQVQEMSAEELCGFAVGLVLCGTFLLAAASLVCRGCRRKRSTVNLPEVPSRRLTMLEETPTSLIRTESLSFSFGLEEDACRAYVFRLYAREAAASERFATEYVH